MRTIALTLALLAAPALAQAPTPAPTATPAAILPRVALATAAGRIVIEVDTTRAPITAANFLRYVDGRKLDGVVFYRAMKLGSDSTGRGTGMVQFGTSNDPKRTLKPITHEPTTKTGLRHDDGAISMAMVSPGTATGDFFIVVGALPGFDAAATDPGFAAFGHVVEGMDVVRSILAAPTSPTEGVGVMKGQMLQPRIKVLTARRLPKG